MLLTMELHLEGSHQSWERLSQLLTALKSSGSELTLELRHGTGGLKHSLRSTGTLKISSDIAGTSSIDLREVSLSGLLGYLNPQLDV